MYNVVLVEGQWRSVTGKVWNIPYLSQSHVYYIGYTFRTWSNHTPALPYNTKDDQTWYSTAQYTKMAELIIIQLCVYNNYVGESDHQAKFNDKPFEDFWLLYRWTCLYSASFFHFIVCGFFRQARAENAAPMLTLNTSNGVFRARMCLLGDPLMMIQFMGSNTPKPLQNGCE